MAVLVAIPVMAADPYPKMAGVEQYSIPQVEEVALARSAAPPSVADHAEVLVLGAHGYETAVKGTNGFVCFVSRAWDVAYDNPEFWSPKIRSPQCFSPAAVRSVLPRYLERTRWVMAGVSKAEMQEREAAEWKAGQVPLPETGSVSLMFSKGGYLNDAAGGAWAPHYMMFVPRTDATQWGADLPGSPVKSDSADYEKTTIIMVMVPAWSDGTPAPAMHQHH
jgi:hypothetical protein